MAPVCDWRPRTSRRPNVAPVRPVRPVGAFRVVTVDEWEQTRRVRLVDVGGRMTGHMPYGRAGDPRRDTARMLFPSGVVEAVRVVESLPRLEGTETVSAWQGTDPAAPVVTVNWVRWADDTDTVEPGRWVVTAWTAAGVVLATCELVGAYLPPGCCMYHRCELLAERQAVFYARFGQFSTPMLTGGR